MNDLSPREWVIFFATGTALGGITGFVGGSLPDWLLIPVVLAHCTAMALSMEVRRA